jgi:3-demethoxyubiquinol 3-hydroxylase
MIKFDLVNPKTGLMGDRMAMKCTEAVETAIGDHYNDQVRIVVDLEKNETDDVNRAELNQFAKDLVEFRDEELEHLEHAKAHNTDPETSFEKAFVAVISGGCKIAVKLAQKI